LPAEFCGGRLNLSTYEIINQIWWPDNLDVDKCLQD
jgi:hypothetical protein